MLPKLRCKNGEGVGNELYISFPDLETPFTFINTDYSAGVSSFSVDNGLKFTIGQYAIIPNIGNEKAEIVRTHASTATTASTITLASATSFAHNRGDMLQFIPYNQVQIWSDVAVAGTFALLATIDINVANYETYYNHTAGTSATQYKVRFKNSTDTTYSDYSDIVLATGYAEGTAGEVIRKALLDTGTKISDVITKEWLYNALNEGRREIDEDKNVLRWSFRTVFDYNAYSIIPGQYKFTLPTNLRDADTNKNIISVRIGKDKNKVWYCDQIDFDDYFEGVAHTTLGETVHNDHTTIVLTDSGDFDESGSIDVAGEAIDEVVDTIDYTDNTETTNTISGVTGIRTAGHSSGVDAWQGATFTIPDHYTVDNGIIYFNNPFEDELAGENVYLDYYKKLTEVSSDADEFDEPFYSIYIPYLRFRIKLRKDENLDWKNDIDYISWLEKKQAQIQKEYYGIKLRLNVDLPKTSFRYK